MKTIIAIACLLITGLTNAQVKPDTIMFALLNQYRIKHNLRSISWDSSIYKEAMSICGYVVVDTVGTVEADDSLIVLAGVYGEYFVEIIQMDAEMDTGTPRLIAGIFLNDVLNTPGAEGLIAKPWSKGGTCVVLAKTLYVPNPARESYIKEFPVLLIVMVIGVSY